MSNYRTSFTIEASDIYNKLSTNDQERFKCVEILNATRCNDGRVIIECFLSENDTKNIPYCQKLLSDGTITINNLLDI